MLHLLDAALRFTGVLYPTPLKRTWIALTALSIILKMLSVWKIPFPAFKLYMGFVIIEALLGELWGLPCELILMLFVLAFVVESLYLSEFCVILPFVRKYDRHFAIGVGALIVSTMVIFPPSIYGKTIAAYVHVYSSAFAAVTIAAAVLHSWNRRIKSDSFIRLHGGISVVWFSITIWCAISKYDPWRVLLIGVSVEVACLIAWLILWWLIGVAPGCATLGSG